MSQPCKFPFLRNRGLVGSSYHVLCPPCWRQLDQEPLSSRIGLKDLARNPKENTIPDRFLGDKSWICCGETFFWCFLEDFCFFLESGKTQGFYRWFWRSMVVVEKTLCIPFEWVLRSHMVGFKMPTRCLLVVSNREAIPIDLWWTSDLRHKSVHEVLLHQTQKVS